MELKTDQVLFPWGDRDHEGDGRNHRVSEYNAIVNLYEKKKQQKWIIRIWKIERHFISQPHANTTDIIFFSDVIQYVWDLVA